MALRRAISPRRSTRRPEARAGVALAPRLVGPSIRSFLLRCGRRSDRLARLEFLSDPSSETEWARRRAHTQSEATHAFLYTGGKMTDLGAYNIDTVGEAINGAGVLVGQTYGVDGSGNPFYHAFIYSGGAFQDLNNLIPAGSGWELTDATAINDKGQIAANGYSTTTGKTHAFLLNPM